MHSGLLYMVEPTLRGWGLAGGVTPSDGAGRHRIQQGRVAGGPPSGRRCRGRALWRGRWCGLVARRGASLKAPPYETKEMNGSPGAIALDIAVSEIQAINSLVSPTRWIT
jgi:hypothetical protein